MGEAVIYVMDFEMDFSQYNRHTHFNRFYLYGFFLGHNRNSYTQQNKGSSGLLIVQIKSNFMTNRHRNAIFSENVKCTNQ